MPKHSKLLLFGLVWVAAYFRLPALFNNHYHADEALFSSWARLIAVWRDPFLSSQLVDKPPLLFYLQAFFYPMFGAVEWASRLPNLIASLLLVPLIALLGWKIYRHPVTALLAALLVALSPIAIQYSATAYTDPLLVTLLILSLLLIIDPQKPLLSGLIFGFAVATKYQAWLFIPLIGAFTWVHNWRFRQWARWLVGFAPTFLLLVLWEIMRTGMPMIWTNQLTNFGGLRLIYSWELGPRLILWHDHWQLFWGVSFVWVFFIIAVFLLIRRAIVCPSQDGLMDLILIIYLSAFAVFHWLVAVPVWDRYFLPVFPLAALILSRGLVEAANWLISYNKPSWISNRYGFGATLPALVLVTIWLAISIPAAQLARSGRWPTGGQPTADQGAWQVAEFLAGEPYGTVLYDHWFSWQWRYHFFDKGVYTSWFPYPAALIEDLAVFGDSDGSRYIVLPDSAAARPIYRAIAGAGFRLDEELRTSYQPGMILYRLIQE